MVRSSQHSARRSACEGGKAGSRFLKMILVCSILEMSKAGSGSNSPNSLGVGTRIGSVLAVSMTLRRRRGLHSASSKGCWGEGWGGAGGGGVGKCRGRGHAGVVAASDTVVAQLAAVARTVACPDCSSCPCCWCCGGASGLCCGSAVGVPTIPPAWGGPLRLAGVPSGSAPGCGGVSWGGPALGGA